MRLAIILCASLALCLTGAKPKKVYQRAKAPVKWDRVTSSLFADNAFDLLAGERPDFDKTKIAEVDKKNKQEKEETQGNGDFDRREMMKKLEVAEQALSECLADAKTFKAGSSKVESSADLMIMMGRTLFNNDPDYKTDDTYLKHAQELFGQAKQIKIFVKKNDYESASSAFSKIKKSCNSCHEGFR